MTDISNLGKISGVGLDEWFIPTMFNAIELDNSFVLWSSIMSEYYIDTTNNLLKIKHFNRIRRSYRANIVIRNNKIYIIRDSNGNYYHHETQFRVPKIGDSLLNLDWPYLITGVSLSAGDIEITVEDQNELINTFSNEISLLDGSYTGTLYTDEKGIYYSKHYKSNNVADIYIDGADIRSVAGKYY